LEITVPADPFVLSFSGDTPAEGHDAAREQHWQAWQQRGLERDARNRRYLLAAASVIALALAGWLSLVGAA
jgi:hypothetical protein